MLNGIGLEHHQQLLSTITAVVQALQSPSINQSNERGSNGYLLKSYYSTTVNTSTLT